MKSRESRMVLMLIGIFVVTWLILHFFMPLFLPFVLGWILAALAQPQILFLQHRLRCPRGVASAVTVSCALVLLAMIVMLIAGFGYREATVLVRRLPEVMETFSEKAQELQLWALSLAAQAPRGLAKPLERLVLELFASGSILLQKATGLVLSIAGRAVGGISGGAFLIGTAVISSYMISSQYPQLHRKIAESRIWREQIAPLGDKIRKALGSWLQAQFKLSGVTFGIVLGGFFLLRVEQPILWAAVTAIVDAVPMLGTGTVLVPMAVISLIWGDKVRGIGLIGLYVTALVIRSSLEPRLVGRQLGLNPLITLLALYVGFRIWGIGGMILAPILAVLAFQLTAVQDSSQD